MEHDRIIRLMTKTDVVLDMMAGIGPFAVPLGKNGNLVYANDLNPNSYKWLVENAKTNKVAGTVRSFNMDGREFTRMINTQVDQAMTLSKTTHPDFTHVVMNLPASAQEFLDVFRGLYATRAPGNRPAKLPTIHCYCFSRADDVETDALAMCSEFLNYTLVKVRQARHACLCRRRVVSRCPEWCALWRVGVGGGDGGGGGGVCVYACVCVPGGGTRTPSYAKSRDACFTQLLMPPPLPCLARVRPGPHVHGPPSPRRCAQKDHDVRVFPAPARGRVRGNPRHGITRNRRGGGSLILAASPHVPTARMWALGTCGAEHTNPDLADR